MHLGHDSGEWKKKTQKTSVFFLKKFAKPKSCRIFATAKGGKTGHNNPTSTAKMAS